MKNVHGKFNSFAELGKALGIKVPQNVEKERKCSNRGNPLRKIGNTNVYICDYSILEDNELNGTPVQVFTKCGAVELSD